MAPDVSSRDWLARMLDEALDARDPEAVRRALPPGALDASVSLDARARDLASRSARGAPGQGPPTAAEAFRKRVGGHVALALDVAAAAGASGSRERRFAEVAAQLAAVAGEVREALAADPAGPRGGEEEVRRALETASCAFAEAGWPPGDPRDGIALWQGDLWIERRLTGRIAAAYLVAGRLEEVSVHRRLEQAAGDRAALAGTLLAHLAAGGPSVPHRRRVIRHQVARLRLPRALERRLREALRSPPSAAEILSQVPRRLHLFLAEQVFFAEVAGANAPAQVAFAEAFAREAGILPEVLPALRAEAAAQAQRQRWLDGGLEWVPGDVGLLAKVGDLLQHNLDAIAQEVRQTGELGQLLGKAAVGTTLTAEEKATVKAHLVDLARVVPALAIFAAPGGMLLLPLLAKLLPFRVLPSAWDREERPPAPSPKKAGS